MPAHPWYRQPWLWFLMIPPLAAVVGGILTLIIATGGADDVVREDVVKVGMELKTDHRRLAAAEALGLSARVHLDRSSGRVQAHLSGPADALPEALRLRLIHPTEAARDRILLLSRHRDGYQSDLGQDALGRRGVQLEPMNAEWRLAGELPAGADTLALGTEH